MKYRYGELGEGTGQPALFGTTGSFLGWPPRPLQTSGRSGFSLLFLSGALSDLIPSLSLSL